MAPTSQADDDVEQISGDEYPGFEGVRFVFSCENISERWADWEELIERGGGIVEESVSEQTDYLIVDDGGDLGEREVASNHRVPVIEDTEFQELLAELFLFPESRNT